ncbi:MAG: alpha/beta fold hydrolase [Akkermansia sp.]|nr:alpha/beta fold hydrolase [Akkermansia sp.]
MKILRNCLIAALLLIAAFWGLAACSVDMLVYPGSTMQLRDANYGYRAHAITIPATDGTVLRGWFFNRGAGTPLVTMFGGNAMNVGAFANIAEADTTRSYLLMNYRGYGGSEGQPSEAAIVADARHCIAHARALLAGDHTPLYLIGFSLGSGVATQVAAAEQPDALVLICPFDSITTVACGIVPVLPRLLPIDAWRSASYAPRITCPVTIFRAQYDTIVPPASTDALIRSFSTPPAVKSYPADHNSIFATPGFSQDIMKALLPTPMP